MSKKNNHSGTFKYLSLINYHHKNKLYNLDHLFWSPIIHVLTRTLYLVYKSLSFVLYPTISRRKVFFLIRIYKKKGDPFRSPFLNLLYSQKYQHKSISSQSSKSKSFWKCFLSIFLLFQILLLLRYMYLYHTSISL